MEHYQRDSSGNFIVVHNNQDRFISLKEAADYLSIRSGSLTSWVSTNKYPQLKSYKIGRYRRFKLNDLQAFVQSRLLS